MKKLLITLGLVIGLVSQSKAITDTFTTINGSIVTNFIDGGLRLTQLTINNNGSNAMSFAIWDSGNTNSTYNPLNGYTLLTYSNPPYQSVIQYATNITYMYTNYAGVTNVKTYKGYFSVTNTVALDSAVEFPIMINGIVPAASTLYVTLPDGGITFARGVTMTNNAATNNATWLIGYSPNL